MASDNKCEYLLIAEHALGRALPDGSEVHHANGIRKDNTPSNLVICESHAYHALLHQRKRAYEACGYAAWLKCHFCKIYSDPTMLSVISNGRKVYHRACQTAYWRKRHGTTKFRKPYRIKVRS